MKKLPKAPLAVEILVGVLLCIPFIPIFWTLSPFFFESGFFELAFSKLFTKSEIIESLWRSLEIALLSSLLALAIAAGAAWRVEKHKDKFISMTLLFSMALPEIVLGLSLLMSYSIIGLQLGTLSVALAHASFTYAFATLIIRSHAQNLDPKIFEAAKDLGATPLQSLIRVTLPLFASSLVSAFLLCMTLSLDDYLISAFTSGAGQDTLPMRIYGLLRYGLGPELKAVTLVLFSASLLCVGIGLPLAMQKNKRAAK